MLRAFFLVAAASAAPVSVHTTSIVPADEPATGEVPGSLSWGIANGMADRRNTVLTDSILEAGKAQIPSVEPILPTLQAAIGIAVEEKASLDLVRAIGAEHRMFIDDQIKQLQVRFHVTFLDSSDTFAQVSMLARAPVWPLQANINGTEYEPVADLVAAGELSTPMMHPRHTRTHALYAQDESNALVLVHVCTH